MTPQEVYFIFLEAQQGGADPYKVLASIAGVTREEAKRAFWANQYGETSVFDTIQCTTHSCDSL